jgi:Tol biopolymer transport system component
MARQRRRATTLALLTAGLALGAPAIAGAQDDVILVSRADGQAGELAPSGQPDISADGRFVAFVAHEPLDAADTNNRGDVYVRDVERGTTTLVSRAAGATGPVGDGSSDQPAISADGRFVAFTSRAKNLGPATTGIRHVFVRDLREDTTTLVSRASGAGQIANFASDEPDISGDGRFVAFTTGANNIVAGEPGAAGVVVRDLVANETTMAGRENGPGGASLRGREPSISADGRYVAFNAGNALVGLVYLRDLRTGTTIVVNPAVPLAGFPEVSDSPSVSDDGRRVAYRSNSPALTDADVDAASAPDVFVTDLDAGTTTLLSGGEIVDHAVEPAISGDGRVVTFRAAPFALTGPSGVFAYDLATGVRTRLASDPGASAVSRDGRYVAFVAPERAFVEGGGDRLAVFRRDLIGPSPGSPSPVCAVGRAPVAAEGRPAGEARFSLTRRQLLINQRIAQAALRRLNAVQERLDGGLSARDLCGHAIGAGDLDPTIATAVAPASLAPAEPAAPEPIRTAPRPGGGAGAVRLSAGQLLVNQRIGQAAVRRANGLAARLEAGLTGGDLVDGQIGQSKLADRLQITGAPATPAPAPSATVIPPREAPADAAAVRLTLAQLRINQRVFQAAVRRANALVARLEAGITGAEIRDGSVTAADLAPGVLRTTP